MTENKLKIAIIGKEDVITGFKFLGLTPFPVTDEKNTRETFLKIKAQIDDFGIIFITENLYHILEEEIEKLTSRTTPAILIIPDNTGSKNIGIKMMSKTVERATGSDILSK